MTRDEILSMPAGRELDALIAEKVMKITPEKCDFPVFTDKRDWVDPGEYFVNVPGSVTELPRYSTDIAATWEVVERLTKPTSFPDIDIDLLTTVRGWLFVIKYDIAVHRANAETAPLAICRAALLAVTK